MAGMFRDFLEMSYEELEEKNLELKDERKARTDIGKLQEARLKDLTDTKGVKAVTVLFSDLEGRLHMLDYDRKFLVGSYDNLTFDGSSIRGFTAQKESDLRLGHRLERLLLDAGRRLRRGQGHCLRRGHRQERQSLRGRSARHPEAVCRRAVQEATATR